MYNIKTIGAVYVSGQATLIEVSQTYRKALKYIEEFSHIHLFYVIVRDNNFYMKRDIVEIKDMNREKGFIEASAILALKGRAELIDIKPYFPSEDRLKSRINLGKNENTVIQLQCKLETSEGDEQYEFDEIGLIRKVNGKSYIQLHDMKEPTGEYINVYWWFSRFDAVKYRKITECNPPYENAPRSGIFATRSPVRPNPIAMTVVQVTSIDKERKRLYINDIEAFDKTPCLGICDYSSDEMFISDCRVPEWLRHWPKYIDENVKTYMTDTIAIYDSPLAGIIRAEKRNSSTIEISNLYDNTISRKNTKPTEIIVRGARENNLHGIDVSIPYGKLTAVVGVSGSGKSSLVNDTIYVECRRRMEYLSHNSNVYQKPLIDEMAGCIPAVVIKQDPIRGNMYSTVGTHTDAYDYLRSIYAELAVRHCPECGNEIIPLNRSQICSILCNQSNLVFYNLLGVEICENSIEKAVDKALDEGEGAFYVSIDNKDRILMQTKQKCYHCNKIMFDMTPAVFSYMDSDYRCVDCNGTGRVSVIDEDKLVEHPELSILDGALSFYGKLRNFLTNPNANWMKGQVFGLADKMGIDLELPWSMLPSSFKYAVLHGSEDEVTFSYDNKKIGRKGEITRQVEGVCGIIERLLEENTVSDSMRKYTKSEKCSSCNGERLAREGRAATLLGKRYPETAQMTFYEIIEFCKGLQLGLTNFEYGKIASSIDGLIELSEAAVELGVGYLELSQEVRTLSGGEGQRLKLIGAFKNHLSGILYIFDEPSKGLHSKDYQKIIGLMTKLIEEGNTIIMVEHNEDMIMAADYVIEVGPGAGAQGGLLVGEGTLTAMINRRETQLSQYMKQSGHNQIDYIKHDIMKSEIFSLCNLNSNNLKNISVSIPVRALTCICGISGSGKSTLMKKEIYTKAGNDKRFRDVVIIDQAAIGKTSKSIVATYIGVMDYIRAEFSNCIEAKENGWDDSFFSFNSQNGQCETCKGEGKIKMKYTEDVYITCSDCDGTRYKKKLLTVLYKGKSVHEMLTLSVNQAIELFDNHNQSVRSLISLQKVGLGYLKLGQGTATLSGGEASRLKLAKELIVKFPKNVLYLFDEPTTGLHFSDVQNLIILIDDLIMAGNTVIAIEHNKQFLNHSDWIVELGPGAGKAGGEIVYQGLNKREC